MPRTKIAQEKQHLKKFISPRLLMRICEKIRANNKYALKDAKVDFGGKSDLIEITFAEAEKIMKRE